ncbi:unnamed protein product [Prorocentrum cordatum]|uniref:N-acetyltransferase domain-containing protein n=1 Tax=Prorocentrum cordatum TaxID=2364126 RepID=A0ABN9TID9_9DINO|nr:unnamed protein product [Polarella glacialis]
MDAADGVNGAATGAARGQEGPSGAEGPAGHSGPCALAPAGRLAAGGAPPRVAGATAGECSAHAAGVAVGSEDPPAPGPERPKETSARGDPEFSISSLEVGDIEEFIALQDLFAGEHLALSQEIYSEVTFRDWQLSLLCPESILSREGGRVRHVRSMVNHDEECFRTLSILKASAKEASGATRLVGYIMFQVHDESGRTPRRGGRHKRRDAGPFRPWVQVKQIFVLKHLRRYGCGSQLLAAMLEALGRIRLSVLDLNAPAALWYRSKGFLVVGVCRELLGQKEEANVIVYQDMQRLDGSRKLEPLAVPLLFRDEVVHEVVHIDYPDDGGSFDLRVVGFNERDKWHYVDSRGLSMWQGDCFVDEVDLNEYYRDGRVQFKRPLSLVWREGELRRRRERRARADERQAEMEERERKRGALDGRVVVSRRLRQKHAGPEAAHAGASRGGAG